MQCETIELHTAELSVARTAVLDYFQSPEQRRLQKLFSWEEEFQLRPNKALVKYLRIVARSLALATSEGPNLLCDSLPISSQVVSFSE